MADTCRMDAGDLFRQSLTMLVRGSGTLTRDAAARLDGDAWSSRPVAGANPPGFVAWHMARAMDWAINCGIRGVPEVAARPEFTAMGLDLGIGAGVTADGAVDIAQQMSRDAVVGYLDAVCDEALGWLAAVPLEELARTNELKAHEAPFEVYLQEGHIADVHTLYGLPNWHLIMRPAGSHIRVHAGELEVLRQAAAGS
jgi:hypothetical protein